MSTHFGASRLSLRKRTRQYSATGHVPWLRRVIVPCGSFPSLSSRGKERENEIWKKGRRSKKKETQHWKMKGFVVLFVFLCLSRLGKFCFCSLLPRCFAPFRNLRIGDGKDSSRCKNTRLDPMLCCSFLPVKHKDWSSMVIAVYALSLSRRACLSDFPLYQATKKTKLK